MELRPLVAPLSATDALVGELVDDDPPLPPTDCLGKRLALVVDGLVRFRYVLFVKLSKQGNPPFSTGPSEGAFGIGVLGGPH